MRSESCIRGVASVKEYLNSFFVVLDAIIWVLEINGLVVLRCVSSSLIVVLFGAILLSVMELLWIVSWVICVLFSFSMGVHLSFFRVVMILGSLLLLRCAMLTVSRMFTGML